MKKSLSQCIYASQYLRGKGSILLLELLGHTKETEALLQV